MHGLRHLRARMLRAREIEPFPARVPWKRGLDYLMYGVGVVQPFALLPQVASIYLQHQTTGVSLVTWSMLTVFNTLWTLYGITHNEKIIIIPNLLLVVFDVTIVVGILRF